MADYVSWTIALPEDFELEVRVQQAAAAPAGSRYEVSAGGRSLFATVAPTAGWREPSEQSIGVLTVPAGVHTVSVRLRELRGERAMNLRGLVLRRRRGDPAAAAPGAALPAQRGMGDSGT